MQEQDATKAQSVGKTSIGGPFTLVDTKGVTVSDKDFRGKWLLLYFGFIFCPDVCPEELSKMTEVADLFRMRLCASADCLEKRTDKNGVLQPIFISVDPHRDSPEKIGVYLKGQTAALGSPRRLPLVLHRAHRI